jgi:hypothetical protein
MKWRDTLERLAERSNPVLVRLAVGLAMLVVLMAAAEHYRPANHPAARPAVPSEPAELHATD